MTNGSTHLGRARFLIYLMLMTAMAAGVYLAGNNAMALWDRDEGWYAEISRAMLQSNPPEWVIPKFQGQPFSGKPALAFWAQAAAMKVFGETAFSARLPSVIAVVLVTLLLAGAIAGEAGRRRALWSAMIFATSLLAIIVAKMCLTDAILLPWIVIAQFCLYNIYRKRPNPWSVLVFWVCVSLGILAKGPVVLGILGGTVAMLCAMDVGKRWKSWHAWREESRWLLLLRPALGLALVAALAGPYFLFLWYRDPEYFQKMIGHHMVGPITVAPLEGHAGPPGFYLLLIWPMFAPWSLLLPIVIFRAFRSRQRDLIRFCLAAVVGPWIVLEIVRQKLPTYLLPVLPALSFLTADLVVHHLRRRDSAIYRPIAVWAASGWLVIVTGLTASLWLLTLGPWKFTDLPYKSMVLVSAVGICYGVSVFELFRRRLPRPALIVMGVGMTLIVSSISMGVLPGLEFMNVPDLVAEEISQRGGGSITEVDYNPPSLAFYTHGHVRAVSAIRDLTRLKSVNRPDWVVISAHQWELDAGRATWLREVKRYRTVDYAGRRQILDVCIAKNIGDQGRPANYPTSAP